MRSIREIFTMWKANCMVVTPLKPVIIYAEEDLKERYQALPHRLRKPALKMLARELAAVAGDIREAYLADPDEWYAGYHFGWGMAVRNLLREKGFGEKYFGIHNLDDIYVYLVEEAFGLSARSKGSK
jgi:hypothetical protein